MRTALCLALAVAAAFAGAADTHASELIDRGANNRRRCRSTARVTRWSRTTAARRGTPRPCVGRAQRPPADAGRPADLVPARLQRPRASEAEAASRYDGPPLAWLVRACKAPDGSYWALQAWERLKPNFGGASAARELRLSHWTGPLPELWLKFDWAYRRFDHLYGALTYDGSGVFGFRSTRAGVPLDTYGRNLYVDTLELALRARLAAREQLPHAPAQRQLLLRLLPARQPPDRQGNPLPRDGDRAGRDARRDGRGQGAGTLRRRPRAGRERRAAPPLRRLASLPGALAENRPFGPCARPTGRRH